MGLRWRTRSPTFFIFLNDLAAHKFSDLVELSVDVVSAVEASIERGTPTGS